MVCSVFSTYKGNLVTMVNKPIWLKRLPILIHNKNSFVNLEMIVGTIMENKTYYNNNNYYYYYYYSQLVFERYSFLCYLDAVLQPFFFNLKTVCNIMLMPIT